MREVTQAGADDVVDAARREADVCRGDDPRPLRGYLAVLGVYCAVVAVATLLSALTGRRLPTRWRVQDLITVTLGTHELSRTLTKDAVTSPLRAPFTRYAAAGGPAEVNEEVRRESQLRHSVGELLTCPFCLDMRVPTGCHRPGLRAQIHSSDRRAASSHWPAPTFFSLPTRWHNSQRKAR
jgi:hypothetical protein